MSDCLLDLTRHHNGLINLDPWVFLGIFPERTKRLCHIPELLLQVWCNVTVIIRTWYTCLFEMEAIEIIVHLMSRGASTINHHKKWPPHMQELTRPEHGQYLVSMQGGNHASFPQNFINKGTKQLIIRLHCSSFFRGNGVLHTSSALGDLWCSLVEGANDMRKWRI